MVSGVIYICQVSGVIYICQEEMQIKQCSKPRCNIVRIFSARDL
jgi:hypothetical protein